MTLSWSRAPLQKSPRAARILDVSPLFIIVHPPFSSSSFPLSLLRLFFASSFSPLLMYRMLQCPIFFALHMLYLAPCSKALRERARERSFVLASEKTFFLFGNSSVGLKLYKTLKCSFDTKRRFENSLQSVVLRFTGSMASHAQRLVALYLFRYRNLTNTRCTYYIYTHASRPESYVAPTNFSRSKISSSPQSDCYIPPSRCKRCK